MFTSILFASIQFICIGLLLWLNTSFFSIVQFVLLCVSIIVGLIALWEMRKSTFSVFPDVKDTSKLITIGIYSYIRHPMYTAVMLFGLSMIASHVSFLSIGVFCILCINMFFKARYEESILHKHFKEYYIYKQKTKRFIPFIW